MTTKEKSLRFQMFVEPSWMVALDEWRAKQLPIPSRAEAIRRLVEQALAGGAKGKR